jgi:RNA-directed DNA polymerase
MHDREKSDGRVLPVKLPNNAQGGAAEAVEGRRPAKGNAASETRPGPRAGQGALSELGRVRRMAATDKDARFTALLHHVDVDRLRAAYFALRPKAAPGVDGVTWADYGLDLEENLQDLHARVHRGAYRAKPSRRVYIPKPDGRQRPLGIATVTSNCSFCSSGLGLSGNVGGVRDALAAVLLDLGREGDAQPVGPATARGELAVGDPVVDHAG